jgi:AraC family transcriptional regulator
MGELHERTRPDGSEAAHPRAVAQATIGSFELFHLRFPPSFRHGVVDPPRGYLAVALEGAVHKTFDRTSTVLSRGSFMSIPAGAAHTSAFGVQGCQVLVVRATDEEGERLFGSLLRSPVQVPARAAGVLGWRLAGELRCRDVSSAIALEGLALELLARADRATLSETGRPQAWVKTVEELLDAATPHAVTLQELGAAVGRHPAQVARAFRRAYGVSVAEYVRWLRLEWATAAVASTDDPLARIALDAGFADQSHFTRCFRRHHGTTPGRYRELVRA